MRRINRGDKKAQLDMWQELETLRETFPYTKEGLFLFASHVLDKTIVGSPTLNPVQMDILDYLCFGGKYLGIMAQRGQAKTTLAAIVCAFTLMHLPHYRILVFSQNGKRAKEIAGWVIKIFYAIEVLDLLLPDTYAGDRSSIEAFDVHWCFRGDDKSPSVACYSIESGAQGARADLILADDVESLQNSRTSVMREWLMEQSLEFESINQYGRIIYLGTPQSSESIYNMLPSRGYNVRIWPGRYPTPDQLDYYGNRLAPLLRKHIEANPDLQHGGGLDGTLGKPTCPEMYDEETLQEKEIRQGLAKFMLQFMLHTGMSDKDRFKLKLENLIVANFNGGEGPVMPVWLSAPSSIWPNAPRFGSRAQDKFYFAAPQSYQFRKFDKTVMYIDGAGGGSRSQDETAYAIVSLLGTYIYVREVDGVSGGYADSELMKIVTAAKTHKVDLVCVEKNYGNGAHMAMLKPLFEKHYPHCRLEEEQVSGQKELRIIDTLEPLLGQHRLVITQQAITRDYQSIQRFPADVKLTYSCFYQMAHVTSDKGCLRHDDRLDALSGACRQVVQFVDYDQARSEAQRVKADGEKFMNTMANPDGYVHYVLSGGDFNNYQSANKRANSLSKFARLN